MDTTVQIPTTTSTDVVRRFYQAFVSGDMVRLGDLMTDDVTFHVPGTGHNAGSHRGKAAVFSFFEQAVALTDGNLRLELHDVLAGEHHVAAVATYRARRPGRADLANRLVQLIRLHDGRVAESWFHSRNQYEVDAFWADQPENPPSAGPSQHAARLAS